MKKREKGGGGGGVEAGSGRYGGGTENLLIGITIRHKERKACNELIVNNNCE
jgi:hypothetical protein